MVHPLASGGWTAEAVAAIPDNGLRYELSDGNLLVTPPPDVAHAIAQDRLTQLLKGGAPAQFLVLDAGIGIGVGDSYYIPDVVVLLTAAVARTKRLFDPADVVLVVEVLSPTTRNADLILKRAAYAEGGIPAYWIVDREARTLTVLGLDEVLPEYNVEAVVKAGKTHRATHPFPVDVDPADLF